MFSKASEDDEGTEKYLPQLRNYGFAFKPIEVIPGGEEGVIDSCVDWFLSDSDDVSRAVEVTGGTKTMSLALAAAALKCRARILYLNHKFSRGKPVFGTETLKRLEWFDPARID